jgi:hypothetical protein
MSDEEARALHVQWDVHFLERMRNSTWTTDAGQFDILSDLKNETGGPIPYEVLVTRGSIVAVDSYHVHVAAVSDVIAAKTFANRVKDLEALPELKAIQSAVEPRSPSIQFMNEPDVGGAVVE